MLQRCLLPEDHDGDEDWDGCPDLRKIDNCQIKLANRVQFDRRSADLSPRMRRALDEVVDTLKAAPDIELFVEGHADSAEGPSDRRARELSQRRVEAVRDHLVRAGIDPIRLEPIGWRGRAWATRSAKDCWERSAPRAS